MELLKKRLVRKKELFSTLSFLLAIIGMFYVINSPQIVGVAATQRVLPIYSVERDNKAVALSFDAAWGNEDTQLLIDILNRYQIKATFFLVGDWVSKYPESVKQLSDAGMEIGNHSDHHDHYTKLSSADIINDVKACNDKIEKITGKAPTLFRCPYGEYDDHVVSAINSIGMSVIQWDVDSLDWKDLSADEITKRVTSKVTSGSICLFHNAAIHTPEALPSIIEYLLSEGYSIIPISDLIYTENYTIDHTGRQFMTTEPNSTPQL